MPRRALLDRYVLTEILGPLALGLLVFTFLLLIDRIFDIASLIIQRNVPALLVGRLLLLNLPHIIVITIPMALLFAILIAVGRLAADSELVALRASGISLFSLYRPVFVLSALLGALTAVGTIQLQPWGNRELQDMQMEIINQSVSKEVEPGVFFEQIDDRILLIDGETPDGEGWQGVFLTESLPLGDFVVTVAGAGTVAIDPQSGEAVLELENSTDYSVDLARPQNSDIRHNGSVQYQLDDLLAARRERRRQQGVRELGLRELQARIKDPTVSARDRRMAEVEWHKKLAIPATCLVFGLFGLPLGFSNRRGGRSSGFALSLLVIFVYYLLMNNGESAAAQGGMSPAFAMWSPNVVFLILGLYILARRNRDKSLLLGRLDRWLQGNLWARFHVRRRLRQLRRLRRRRLRVEEHQVREMRGNRSHRESADLVLRLERPRFRFPNTFDRYLLTAFSRTFVLVLASAMGIYMIANFTTVVDDVLENEIPSRIVLSYYGYSSFQIFHTIAPLAVLLSTLISFGVLARNNEITAAKALGTSLYRLALPVLVAAAAVGLASAFIGSAVLPSSNARVAELRDEIQGSGRIRTYKRANQQWVFSRGKNGDGYIYHYQYYDPRRQALQRLHVFRLGPGNRTLEGHLFATEAVHSPDGWRVSGSWMKSIRGTRAEFSPIPDGARSDLEEDPELFSTEIKRPEQMTYPELAAYISQLESSGQRVPDLEVELHNKIALPAVCLVMALVALPFAFHLGRRGALYGVGIAVILGMAFYALIAFFTTLGETGTLPAVVAVWSPNLLFTVLSLYLFLGIRT